MTSRSSWRARSISRSIVARPTDSFGCGAVTPAPMAVPVGTATAGAASAVNCISGPCLANWRREPSGTATFWKGGQGAPLMKVPFVLLVFDEQAAALEAQLGVHAADAVIGRVGEFDVVFRGTAQAQHLPLLQSDALALAGERAAQMSNRQDHGHRCFLLDQFFWFEGLNRIPCRFRGSPRRRPRGR